MHKIVEEFIKEKEGLIVLVSKYYDPSNLLEKAFFELMQAINTRTFDPNWLVSLDEVLLKGHDDPDLMALFLIDYIVICFDHGEKGRASIAYQISQSVDISRCHSFIQLYYDIQISSYLCAMGQMNKIEETYLSILKQLAKKKNRSPILIGNIAQHFTNHGKLLEIDGKYIGVMDFKGNQRRTFAYLSFLLVNSFLICDTEVFRLHWPAFRKCYPLPNDDYLIYYNELQKLITLDFEFTTYRNPHLSELAGIYKRLLEGHFDEIKDVKHDIEKIPKLNASPHLHYLKFIPLHIALNKHDVGKARLLLFEMTKGGDLDYITDFFRVRLALLEGEKEKALQYYQRLSENLRRYKAFGRLAFEMTFSHELKKQDLLFLSEGIIQKYIFSKKSIAIQNVIDYEEEEVIDTSMVGNSKQIRKIRRQIAQYADLEETVYVHGETGTGKELVARALHENSSRKDELFLAINCGALTDTLLESDLFGHEVGAFTGAHKARAGIFESAGKGTVFLDEFGEISHRLQVALLRVLENREIRPIGSSQAKKIFCRIVVSSNKNLVLAVEEKKLREDLYYRVNRFDIYLPPLRERKEDIPLLLHHYLNWGLPKSQKMALSDELLGVLSDYHWPGNIRELKNEIERCRIVNKGKSIVRVGDFELSRLRQLHESEEMPRKNNNTPLATERALESNDRVQEILSRSSKMDTRLEYLQKLFQTHKKLTRVQIMEILQISQSTASKYLHHLIEKDMIKKEMPTKSARSYYFVLKEKKAF